MHPEPTSKCVCQHKWCKERVKSMVSAYLSMLQALVTCCRCQTLFNLGYKVRLAINWDNINRHRRQLVQHSNCTDQDDRKNKTLLYTSKMRSCCMCKILLVKCTTVIFQNLFAFLITCYNMWSTSAVNVRRGQTNNI